MSNKQNESPQREILEFALPLLPEDISNLEKTLDLYFPGDRINGLRQILYYGLAAIKIRDKLADIKTQNLSLEKQYSRLLRDYIALESTLTTYRFKNRRLLRDNENLRSLIAEFRALDKNILE